jgi:eukaryotic-like serine/threonine-protein kinase
LTLDGVKDLVQRLDGNGFRLAILLDEFDCVTTNPNFDLEFFSFLRFLANHYNVAYLTSSARDLQSLCHTKEISDSPFFNIFSTLRLSTFLRDEAEELIRVPSRRVGRPLETHTDRILEISGLFPFFIQMTCSYAIEYLEEHPGQEPDFDEVRRSFYEEAQFHFRYMWESFDAHEKSAVLRVARQKKIPDALRHIVGELEGKRYVESSQRGGRLFSTTFEEFVKRESERQAKPSMLDRLLRRSEPTGS